MKIKLLITTLLISVQLVAQLEVNRNDVFSTYREQTSLAKTPLQ